MSKYSKTYIPIALVAIIVYATVVCGLIFFFETQSAPSQVEVLVRPTVGSTRKITIPLDKVQEYPVWQNTSGQKCSVLVQSHNLVSVTCTMDRSQAQTAIDCLQYRNGLLHIRDQSRSNVLIYARCM